MALSRARSILGITSIALILILSYILFATPHKPEHDLSRFHDVISVIVLSFNIVIAVSWAGFGIITGITLSVLSFFIVLAGVLRSGYYNDVFFISSFIITALLGYAHWKKGMEMNYSSGLKLEKSEEDINILTDNVRKDKIDAGYLEERLLRYMVLKDVAEALTVTLTLEEIVNLIIEKTSGTLKKGGRVLLFLVDMEKQELMLSASQGERKIAAKKGDIFDLWVLKHAIPLIVEDVTVDFRFSIPQTRPAAEAFRSLIITPLLSGNKVIGLLRMDSSEPNFYTQDDLRLMDIIGGLSAVAIQNAFFYSLAKDLAIRDSLTGLFVRRYFMERLQGEMQRCAKRGSALSLLMLDIDRFKWYNDKYGHATGDLVLKHITTRIKEALREEDMVARYGGEEIAVLLSGYDKAKATKIAESVRKKIEKEPLEVRRERHSVTVSIGVATHPEDSTVEQDLVRIADERLYKAKSLGRNRTCAD